MPIQKQFKLNRVFRTSQDLNGRKFLDLINKVASLASFPANSTTVNVNINYKGQLLHGNLLQTLNDIQEIGESEIFEYASANFQANLNPIKSLNYHINLNGGQVNIQSNNISNEEFETITKLTEQTFPISVDTIPQQQNPQQITPNINEAVSNVKSDENKLKVNSKTVFVIMSFNDEHRDSYYVAIHPTLKKLGFDPIRVDEIQHNNTVTKEIIEAIESSAFVVADLTGERPNVYYEVGYAHKADKEVVLLAKKGTAIHFDVAAINRIDYKDYTDLCDSLEKRVKAVANRLGISNE